LHSETSLIATIILGIVLAFVFGTIAFRLRLPPLVGYLIAGILVGPYTPGYVADQSLVPELAELGVILLMFGVGLHFSLKELLSVKAIAVPGAIIQIGFATALGAFMAWVLGWPVGADVVFGLSLSVASTVVLLRALQERHLMQTERGRIAVGWLIVEDLAMVLTLVLLPPFAHFLGTTGGGAETLDTGFGIWGIIGLTLLKIGGFIAFMLIVGRRVIPWILHYIAHTGSRELFRLAVLAIALGVAFGAAKLFGVSLALGAFFAGMILSESDFSHQAAKDSLPLRDAFAVLFFVSVGMLFDPTSIWREPLPILFTLFIIVVGKALIAFLIVMAFRYPLGIALTISASLAQIGEFSFILADLGVNLKLLPEQGRDLILAGAILSIILNPLVFACADWIKQRHDHATQHPETKPAAQAEAAAEALQVDEQDIVPTNLTDHTILVGYGRIGKHVARGLQEAGEAFIVIDDDDDAEAELHEKGIEIVSGNAVQAENLLLANIGAARRVILTIPNAYEAGQIVSLVQAANPKVLILSQADTDVDADYLKSLGVAKIVLGSEEVARRIVQDVLFQPTVDPGI